jgi:uncharacterized membrane protein
MRKMENKINSTEKMLALSMGFTLCLLVFRIVYSGTLSYIFFAWNLFLASIPFLLSRRLKRYDKLTKSSFLLLAAWLLFLPNAPYVITDIFHFRERYPVPKWYDLLIVISAGWNGLCLGFTSLMQVEQFLSKFLDKIKVQALVFCFMFLCGYGIYIGRFMRYNSWDIVSDPLQLISESMQHVLFPREYFRVWEFTFLFSAMLTIIYYTLKNLPINNGNRINITAE